MAEQITVLRDLWLCLGSATLTFTHVCRPPCSLQITPRAISAHAYVNAAFVLPLDASFTVTEKPTLLFGGISADFVSCGRRMVD